MQNYDLQANFDSRASFYGKARVQQDGNTLYLVSYTTEVAKITLGTLGRDGEWKVAPKAEVYGTYSTTTLRHIKEFLKQNGFKAENSKQIMADYGVEK